jgi:hypothetical protein
VTTPRVSVIIPCHNAARWIADTVASAAGQSGVVLEILVVDDGSSDGSAEIAEKVGGPLVRVRRQANGGASRARNAGTAAARGEFLQYLDADDVLTDGTIAARVGRLDATGADVAYCDWVRWESDGDGRFVEREVVTRTLGDRPDLDLLCDAWWPPAALMYRRAAVARIGAWREDLPIIQDARFLQDAAFTGATFAHVAAVGAKYRVHGSESLSRRDPRAFLDDCFHNASTIEAMWTTAGELTAERRRMLARVFAHVARAAFSLDRRRFDAAVRRVVALEPDFTPDADRPLRALSRVVGYPRAEYVAGWWRRGRAVLTAAR